MTDLKVTFPEPCTEPWEEMAPAGCNRHCASCDKVIHDLASLTLDEAEKLLETEDEVCVRARVKNGGEVKLAASATSSRRMVAVLGASASLALAACATPDKSTISPRYEISGSVTKFQYATKARLIGYNRKYTATVGRDDTFRFGNLKAGVYTLQFDDMCGQPFVMENIIVRDADVNLGTVEWEEDCIIVGKMMPADPPQLG